jgi:hypothetical protein
MSDTGEIDLVAIEAMASTVQGWDYGGLAGQIPGTIRALITEVRRLRPRTLSTAEELEAEPLGVVVRTVTGVLYEKFPAGWGQSSGGFYESTWLMRGESFVSVIYTPEKRA